LLAAPSRISGFAIITLPSAGKVYWVFALAALSPISPLIANAMKHPSRSDFHTVVTAAGVSVTFKPTNSTYSFFRFAETGALSLAGIQHAGRDTDDYPSDEVQDMALQIASGHASVHFGPFQDEEEVNRVHWRNFATQAKRESEPTTIFESIRSASAHKSASDLRMLVKVEKWMAIIREINREQLIAKSMLQKISMRRRTEIPHAYYR
jgi:hypothetical protein